MFLLRIRTNSMDGTFNDEESVIDETETVKHFFIQHLNNNS